MAASPGSAEKLTSRKSSTPAQQADIEAALRDSNCADSCSSLDNFGRPCADGSVPSGSGSDSGSGVLDWQPDADPDDGGDEDDAAGTCSSCRCSGGVSVALVCLLLTLGSFVAPGSNYGVDALARHVVRGAIHLGNRAREASEDAQYHSSVLVSKLKGERHCRPAPSSLRGNVTKLHVAGMEEVYKMQQPRKGGRWLVQARTDGLLTVMTPIYPDKQNLALLLNQLRSANQFLNMDSIKEWIFVTPKEKVPRMVNFLEEELVALPCVLARKMRVVADEACVPELRPGPLKKVAGDMADSISGWYKQQLVKLACSFTVTTPYFLVTDADTFFLRPFEALDLMYQQEGCAKTSGVCDLQKQVHFRARNEMQNQAVAQEQEQIEWLSRSARVLNITLNMPKGGMDTMGVTPQIMARGVLDQLVRYMNANVVARGESWRAYLLRLHAEQLRDPQRREHAAWTEYDLYWVYAYHKRLWDRYHMHSVLQRTEANLWWKEQFDSWDPCAKFDTEDDRGYWAVVQSRLNIEPRLIWEKLKPCMSHSLAEISRDTRKGSGDADSTEEDI